MTAGGQSADRSMAPRKHHRAAPLPPAPRLPLLLLLLALVAGTALPPRASAQPSGGTCIPRDRDALLAFKAGLTDPGTQLRSWTAGGDCCQFAFVRCNAGGEVTNLTLRSIYPDDCEDRCDVLQVRDGVQNLIGSTLSRLAALEVLDLRVIRFRGAPYPVGLGALTRLRELALAGLELQGALPPDLGGLAALRRIEVSNLEPLVFSSEIGVEFSVEGGFPAALCGLPLLEEIDFRQEVRAPGRLEGPLPACLGELRNLRVLSVESNRFSGALPGSLAGLSRLEELRVTNNRLSGNVPAFLGGLAALRVLNLDGNEFTGAVPASIFGLPLLTDLRLGGFLPITDFNRVLGTEKASAVTGSLPNPLNGKLKNLQTLIIQSSRLSGSIPSDFGNTNVTTLILSNNKLTGSIPQSLTRLTFTNLNLSRNDLQGPIPTNLKVSLDLSAVSPTVDLSFNRLTGAINPASLVPATTVLLNNNLLTGLGTEPPSQPNNVIIFDLHSNRFTGTVPAWLLLLDNAQFLDISDNRFTAVPSSSSGPARASYLNISNNAISGPIPDYLLSFRSASTRDLSRNRFTGAIPAGIPSADQPFFNVLNLGDNQLTGPIPASLLSGALDVVILNKNRLTGAIPELLNWLSVRVLDLSDNLLEGPVPAELFGDFTGPGNLFKLKLGNNRLSGAMPNFTKNCGVLKTLVLEKNALSGPVFPEGSVLKNCRVLEVLDFSDNALTGTVPSAVGRLDALRVLDVGHNSLSGSVQSNLQNLRNLQVLDLSSNRFSGIVPFSKLSSGLQALRTAGAASAYTRGAPLYQDLTFFDSSTPLQSIGIVHQVRATGAIDLSGNVLQGAIDASIGNLKGLHLLDLSDNRFTGGVPSSVADITDLEDFDVSNNRLSGRIPAELSRFPTEDFTGNPSLCGPPLATPCP